MKVVVEFDLPEGQAIPDPREIVMLTSPDWIASWWHIDDVSCLLYTSPSPRDGLLSRMPSSA